ncbi:MAG: hypothetical protein KAV87_14840, partial [Desulfobacteraceae bacterium]|nr:hypothetical protein [Desulfobacteraceae bacterium]
IYAELYKKSKSFSIWPPSLTDQDNHWWTIKDALGNPLPNAKVKIFIDYTVTSSRRPPISGIWLSDTRLDKKGRLKQIRTTSKYWRLELLVSHPDYGTAFAAPYGQPVTYYVVPFARMDADTVSRSLWGTVVDAKGNPISGALIECGSVAAPGGVGIVVFPSRHRILTDERGRFFLSVPTEEGKLAPPNSKYGISVKPPNDPGPASRYGHVPSGKECTITLEHDGYFHTFAFEDVNGPITDPNRLKKIRVIIDRPGQNTLYLQYDLWKDGGMFPSGTYRAVMRETKPLLFKPIGVTAESPEELVFKLSDDILYHGQIVDGVTAKPIPGALVMKGEFNPPKHWGDFSIITPEQWQAIHRLPANPPLDDKALEPLREACKLEKIVRTDQQGWFEISGPATGRRSEVIAVEEDYIGCVCWSNSRLSNRSYAKPDANGLVEIPRTKLFPTATIVFEPHIEEEDDTADVRARWIIDSDNNPAWVEHLKSGSYVFNRGFWPNRWQSMHVPAGLNIRIRLFLTSNRLGNAYWGHIILAKTSNLAQGQTLDLGRLTFPRAKPTFPIHIKVVNSRAQPVEGVGVWRVLDDRFWGHSCITNEFGIATFKVPLHCKGEFHVGFDEDGLKLKESIPFQMGGEEDVGRQFTLQLSDKMLYHLFK